MAGRPKLLKPTTAPKACQLVGNQIWMTAQFERFRSRAVLWQPYLISFHGARQTSDYPANLRQEAKGV